MTLKEKELLLKDLCARLPYKVKAQIPDEYGGYTSEIESIDIDGFVVDFEGTQIEVECIKPYLLPLSSMTAEQLYELRELFGFEIEFLNGFIELSSRDTLEYLEMIAIIEWFNKNHFDYRGLIPMGLAIDATGLNIYLYERRRIY